MGAVLTARLRKTGEISRIEGERLLAFTNNPSPGFMFGAVASGMLGKPTLGIVLAGSVYLANLIVGFFFRFYHINESPAQPIKLPSFKRAWRELKTAQLQDKRALGQILSDSIKQSFSTVLMVGGFMAFFSVILRLLNIWHLTLLLATLSHYFLRIIPISSQQAFFNGLLEMTIGCQQAIQSIPVLNQQVGLLTFLMGWSGLSVFAQVIGFISGTDLRVAPFILARTLHGILALGLSQIFLRFAKIPASIPALQLPNPSAQAWNTWHLSVLMFIGFAVILFSLAIGQRLHR
jgi:sporulation integral membrane protein YlbJ